MLRPAPKPKLVKRPPPKRIPAVNPARAKKRRARDFGSQAEWVRTLPCAVSGKKTGELAAIPGSFKMVELVLVEAAHATSRGAGGRSAECFPLARHLHRLQHAKGWSAIGLTLEHAKQLAKEYHVLFLNLFEREEPTT